MGWMGYTGEIPIGMLFRKMYCHRCGVRLKREKQVNVYHKGDEGYDKHIFFLRPTPLGMDKAKKTHFVYVCPNCNSRITYNEQRAIARKQRKLKSKIISENE